MNPIRTTLPAFVGGLLLSAGGWAFSTSAWSDDTANADAGRELASKLCARCHAVGASGGSPLATAPPFRTFAAKWPLENLEEALAEGIVVGHKDMPEFELEPAQISNFLAYLRSVQKR